MIRGAQFNLPFSLCRSLAILPLNSAVLIFNVSAYCSTREMFAEKNLRTRFQSAAIIRNHKSSYLYTRASSSCFKSPKILPKDANSSETVSVTTKMMPLGCIIAHAVNATALAQSFLGSCCWLCGARQTAINGINDFDISLR